MNTLRRVSAAMTLCLMLAISAFAGHIETPGSPGPGGPGPRPVSTTTRPGQHPTSTTTTDITTYILLTITSLIYR